MQRWWWRKTQIGINFGRKWEAKVVRHFFWASNTWEEGTKVFTSNNSFSWNSICVWFPQRCVQSIIIPKRMPSIKRLFCDLNTPGDGFCFFSPWRKSHSEIIWEVIHQQKFSALFGWKSSITFFSSQEYFTKSYFLWISHFKKLRLGKLLR